MTTVFIKTLKRAFDSGVKYFIHLSYILKIVFEEIVLLLQKMCCSVWENSPAQNMHSGNQIVEFFGLIC